MNLSRILAYLSMGLLMMVLSACSSLAVTDTDECDVDTKVKSLTDQDELVMPIEPIHSGPQSANPNKVVQKARKWLADYRGVPVGHVKAISVERAEWPDSCLGLSEPDEICATVMVPGYKIIFDVRGQKYEVRTDMTANIIRVVKIG